MTIVAGLATAVGYAGYVVLETADVLPGDVEGMLRNAQTAASSESRERAGGSPENSGSLEIVHDGYPLSDAARGVQLVFFGLFIGGIPMAVTATMLAWCSRRHHWVWADMW